jgi:hypothetical protein
MALNARLHNATIIAAAVLMIIGLLNALIIGCPIIMIWEAMQIAKH